MKTKLVYIMEREDIEVLRKAKSIKMLFLSLRRPQRMVMRKLNII